jgi:hypothetical protein
MPKYQVAVTEVVQYLVPVEASDLESAEQVAINKIVNAADRDKWFVDCHARECDGVNEWSGHPCPDDPDNFWIDDATGERIPAH